MRFKRSLVDPTTERTEQAWAKIGVEQFHGRARFVGPTTLAVGADRLTGRRVLIAAGAMPAPLPFPGADRLTTSEQFLNLDALPPRIVFVGGGYIAFEFAHVAARAGVEVTILHRGARPLEAFDPDLVDLLVRRTRDLGHPRGARHRGPRRRGARRPPRGARRAGRTGAPLRDRHGGPRRGSGARDRRSRSRRPRGVKREKRGVVVNEYLQSVSNPAVYAGGDAAANGPPLTPKADHDAGC